jgi:hypothetical protein
MADVERIWRITTEKNGTIDVRLRESPVGDRQVILEHLGSEDLDGDSFDVPVARALAQAMLEACEVASALGDEI